MTAAHVASARLQEGARTGNLLPGPSGGRGVHAYAAELEGRIALAEWGPDLEVDHATAGAATAGLSKKNEKEEGLTGPQATLKFLRDKLSLRFEDEPVRPHSIFN